VDDLGRDLSRDDLAEQAVGHRREHILRLTLLRSAE
jgi:hypothetical protein